VDFRGRARWLALVALLAAQTARADDEPIRLNVPLDASIATGAALVWIFTESVTKDSFAPSDCRWCDGNGLDDGVRTALKWDDVALARGMSDATALLGPVAVLTLDAVAADTWTIFGEDALVMVETAAIAMDVNQMFKFIVGRQRPFVRFGQGGVPKSDHNLSFFSGHATWTFAMATSGATLAYIRGRSSGPLVLGVGLGFASLTGWLRIAGDKHYFSDVLVGALWGAGIGFAIPWFFHRPHAPKVKITAAPMPGGGYLGVSGRF
jgi:membrane-associated phospholipid phosphatase